MSFESKGFREQSGEVAKEIRRLAEKVNDTEQQWTDDDEVRWAKVNSDYDALRDRIEKIERAESIDAEVAALREEREKELSVRKKRSNMGDDAPTEDDRRTAMLAWFRSQSNEYNKELTDSELNACDRVGIDLSRGVLDIPMLSTSQLRHFIRSRRESRASLTATTGGEFVPEGFVATVEQARLAYGGMISVSEVLRTDSGNDLPWPMLDDTGNSGSIIDEGGSVGTTDITTSSLVLQAFRYTSNFIKASAEILEDSGIDLPGILGEAIGTRIQRAFNAHCTTGTGSSQPRGIVTAAPVGTAPAADGAIADTDILNLVHDVDPAYRSGAGFLMNDSICLVIRKLQDSQGRFVWSDGLSEGQSDRLLGYPVTINQDMDSTEGTAGDNDVIVFGRLSAYKIREVRGLRFRRLLERFADTDEEGFVGFMRLDGDLLAPNATNAPVKKLRT